MYQLPNEFNIFNWFAQQTTNKTIASTVYFVSLMPSNKLRGNYFQVKGKAFLV